MYWLVKVVKDTGKTVQVFCEMENDGGGWTLIEMISSGQREGSPFDWTNLATDYPTNVKIGTMWQNNQNQPARLAVATINSIFKHSLGFVTMRYNNNAPGYALTEIYGSPETDVHILSSTCSHKSMFNIALAYRSRPGSSMGFCFLDGRRDTGSNCICGDSNTAAFNLCPGKAGNRRRYNSYKSDNLLCSGMHTKCYGVASHYAFGDSYNCNKPSQGRDVAGHMWVAAYFMSSCKSCSL